MASYGTRDIEIQAAMGRTALSDQYYATLAEESYLASKEYTIGSVGNTATLTIVNPAGSGTSTPIAPVTVDARVASYGRIYTEFTDAPSGGTEVTPTNTLAATGGDSDTTALTVRRGDTFTADGGTTSRLVSGGGGGSAIGGTQSLAAAVLEPGRELVVEVEKLENGGDELTITARWFEIPVVLSETNIDYPLTEVYD
jgi:hypothetical protein